MKTKNDSQVRFYDNAYSKNAVHGISRKTVLAMENFIDIVYSKEINRVLEIGCGDGLLTRFLLEKGLTVRAIDISPVAISKMKNKFVREIKNGKLVVKEADLLDYLLENKEKYDVVIGSGIIHHINIKSWYKIFKNIHASLNKGGVFMCGPEPNANYIFSLLWPLAPFIYRMLGTSYEWSVEKGTMDMKTKNIKNILFKAGFKKVNILPYQIIPDFNIGLLILLNKALLKIISGENSMYIIVKAS